MIIACKNCKNCYSFRQTIINARTRIEIKEKDLTYLCRRFPPIYSPQNEYSVFPEVEPLWFRGEYMEKKLS